MIRLLMKKQLLELFQMYVIDRKTGKARDQKGILTMSLLGVGLLVFVGYACFKMANGLGDVTLGHGLDWLFFSLAALLATALGVFGSVFNTFAALYMPKDNEFLLSLPIPEYKLLLARVGSVYAIAALYTSWIWIPFMIAYWMNVTLSATIIIFPIILLLILILFVTVLTCILGYLVAIIASKAKGKAYITVLLSLTVMGLYYFVYFKIMNSMEEYLKHIADLGNTVEQRLHFVYWIGKGATGNVRSFLIVVAIVALFTLAVFYVLAHRYGRLTLSNKVEKKKVIKPFTYTNVGYKKALEKREFTHFTSVPTWMLNSGLSVIILPVLAIAALIKKDLVDEMFREIGGAITKLEVLIPVLIFIVVGVIISTGAISAASISLEGNTLWILQSLPVPPLQILRAKEKMAFKINILPALFATIVLSIVLRVKIPVMILLVIAVTLYIVFMTDLGLVMNMRLPNLHWTNETKPIKASLPVTIYMFGGWALMGLLFYEGSKIAPTVGVYGLLGILIGVLVLLIAVLQYDLIHFESKTLPYID